MTKGDLDEGREYSWKDVAHDIHEALVSTQMTSRLGVDKDSNHWISLKPTLSVSARPLRQLLISLLCTPRQHSRHHL